MNFTPINNNVLVRESKAEEMRKGSIILPGKEEPNVTAKVIAVGTGLLLPDGTRTKLQVSEGDIVVFPRYAAKEVNIDEEEFLLVTENELLMVSK
jgi:chaperonin GroES